MCRWGIKNLCIIIIFVGQFNATDKLKISPINIIMKNKDSKKNFENLVKVQATSNKRTWHSPEIRIMESDQIELNGGPKFDGGLGTYLDG